MGCRTVKFVSLLAVKDPWLTGFTITLRAPSVKSNSERCFEWFDRPLSQMDNDTNGINESVNRSKELTVT